MDVSNKIFKNRLTGEIFTIIDQYQNIAITSDKQKIDVNLLSNDKLFIPVDDLWTYIVVDFNQKTISYRDPAYSKTLKNKIK